MKKHKESLPCLLLTRQILRETGAMTGSGPNVADAFWSTKWTGTAEGSMANFLEKVMLPATLLLSRWLLLPSKSGHSSESSEYYKSPQSESPACVPNCLSRLLLRAVPSSSLPWQQLEPRPKITLESSTLRLQEVLHQTQFIFLEGQLRKGEKKRKLPEHS